jgi:hypothetical protein
VLCCVVIVSVWWDCRGGGPGSWITPVLPPLPPPHPVPLSRGIVGVMNYFLQSGLLAINPALVPSVPWAAEHSAGQAVFVLLLATRGELPLNGKAWAPGCRQWNTSHTCGAGCWPPGVGMAGGGGRPAKGICLGGRWAWILRGEGRSQENSQRGTRKMMPWPLNLVQPLTLYLTTCLNIWENLKKKCTLCSVASKWFFFPRLSCVFGWVFLWPPWLRDVSYPFKR